MARNALTFSAVTASGDALEFDFEVNEQTATVEHVASLLSAVLATVDVYVSENETVNNGDILQALTMALGVRAHMTPASTDELKEILIDLQRRALRAARKRSDLTRLH